MVLHILLYIHIYTYLDLNICSVDLSRISDFLFYSMMQINKKWWKVIHFIEKNERCYSCQKQGMKVSISKLISTDFMWPSLEMQIFASLIWYSLNNICSHEGLVCKWEGKSTRLSVQVERKKYKVSQSECTECAQALFCKVGALGVMGLVPNDNEEKCNHENHGNLIR